MRVKMCYFVWHAKADGDWYTFTILPWKLMFEDNFKTTIFEYSQRQKGPGVCLPKDLNTKELTRGLIDSLSSLSSAPSKLDRVYVLVHIWYMFCNFRHKVNIGPKFCSRSSTCHQVEADIILSISILSYIYL